MLRLEECKGSGSFYKFGKTVLKTEVDPDEIVFSSELTFDALKWYFNSIIFLTLTACKCPSEGCQKEAT